MKNRRLIPWTGIALLLVAGSLPAQRGRPVRGGGQGDGRPLQSIEITVEDMGSNRFLPSLQRGDTVVIRPGQQIRLRMTGSVGGNANPRYPSTRFDPNDSRYVRVDRVNPDVGTIIVTGVQPNPGPGALVIEYEVYGMPVANDRLRTGRVYVRVEADQPERPPGRPPSDERGVTLYSDDYFRGRSQTFTADDPDLRDNAIQSDTVSSVRVSPGCRATLFEDSSYRGRSAVVDRDAETLRGLGIGNDSVSSLRVDCRGGGGTARDRGINVYADVGFRGAREFLAEGDYSELGGRVGNDAISSIEISEGCRAVLFADARFRGRSWEITDNVSDLGRTPIGNDSISSIQITCR